MQNCTRCGTGNPTNSNFCNSCGCKLGSGKSSGLPLSDSKFLVGWFIPVNRPQISIKIMGKDNSIGRTSESEIDLSYYLHFPPESDLNSVSRVHAKLVYDDKKDTVYVIDTGSSNKTYLNNQELTPYEKTELPSNCSVKFGKLELKFKKFNL